MLFRSNFINKNINEDYIYNILYNNDIDPKLRQRFIECKNDEKRIYSVSMELFCKQFEAVTRNYIKKTEDNISIWSAEGLNRLIYAIFNPKEFIETINR